jgi:hypothetical protein
LLLQAVFRQQIKIWYQHSLIAILKAMKNLLLKFVFATTFAMYGLTALAQAPSDTRTTSPSNIVKTPAGDSIVATLDMGAHATEFWRKIQALVAEPEMLADFPRLVKHLNLDVPDAIGQFDPSKAENQEIFDIKDAFPNTRVARFISGGRFYVSNFGKTNVSFSRVLSMDLESKQICLSGREVERVYGSVEKIAPFSTHNPPSIAEINNPIGYGYSLFYKFHKFNTELNFRTPSSGCVNQISIFQYFN